jgi:hypothetical protein
MSSTGKLRTPLMNFRPKPALNLLSSSITWTNPRSSPNSTWK